MNHFQESKMTGRNQRLAKQFECQNFCFFYNLGKRKDLQAQFYQMRSAPQLAVLSDKILSITDNVNGQSIAQEDSSTVDFRFDRKVREGRTKRRL